jgi:phosphomannomutase
MRKKDLAIRTAEATGATYVLAQDPDADRFSAAERKYGDLTRSSDLSRLRACGVFVIGLTGAGWYSPEIS